MPKIYLSPSSQPKNTYAYGNTNEQENCRELARVIKASLERCGFEVKCGDYGTMYDRVAESNKWGADLHMPIHTNGANGTVQGTRFFVYSSLGTGMKYAKPIFEEVDAVCIGNSSNIKINKDLFEVKRSYAPCVYTEANFHDNYEASKQLVEEHDKIAEAFTKGVCRAFGVTYVSPVEPQPQPKEGYCNVDVRILKKGMRGNDVRVAMLTLKDKGYYKGTISSTDKLFGDGMYNAVIAYQKACGIAQDGVIGADTWGKLLAE